MRGGLAAIGVLIIAVLSGCATDYVPKLDTHPMDPIIEFVGPGSVSLINNQPTTEKVEVFKNLVFVDYQKWTSAAIQIIERECKQRHITIDPNARKTLKIAVKEVQFVLGWVQVQSHVVMHVETSSGYSKEFIGRNHAIMAANRHTLLDGAMMRVVAAMLNDPEIIRYLTH